MEMLIREFMEENGLSKTSVYRYLKRQREKQLADLSVRLGFFGGYAKNPIIAQTECDFKRFWEM